MFIHLSFSIQSAIWPGEIMPNSEETDRRISRLLKFGSLLIVVYALYLFAPPIIERIRAGANVKAEIYGLKIEVFESKVNDARNDKNLALDLRMKFNKSNWPEWASIAIGQRAKDVYAILLNKKILWVDDLHPRQNVLERRLMREIGLSFDSVRCPQEARKMLDVEKYDAVIVESSVFKWSDGICVGNGNERRPDKKLEAGKVHRSEFVDWLAEDYPNLPVIAYSGTLGRLKKSSGVQPGLFGATHFTVELFNLVMDAMARGPRAN